MASIRGGHKLAAHLDRIAARVATAKAVRVGFLEDATYPAAQPGADQLMRGLDKLNSVGPFKPGAKPRNLRDYRKRQKLAVGPPAPAATLHVAQVAFWDEFGTTRAPARPFMRNTIAVKSPEWGAHMGALLKANGYNAARTLTLMGVIMQDQFVKAIVDWPADNAPLTIAIKGFNKGLVHKGVMQRSVDYAIDK